MTYLQTGKAAAITPEIRPAAAPALNFAELAPENEAEVLAFLSENIAQTFGMVGLIHSNGLVSLNNRGTFYACRDREGRLEGVALVGYCTLFEVRRPSSAESAIRTFARLADNCPDFRMVLGEEEPAVRFWNYYLGKRRAFTAHRYILLVKHRGPAEAFEPVDDLRRATPDDLDLVAAAHAKSLFEEAGVDRPGPDMAAFVRRCAERIRKGQTWIWTEGKTLIAKAEVITDTPELTYLEAIWVNGGERRKGYGSRFVSQLSNTLLQRTESVCLLAREENVQARGLYGKIGYKPTSNYKAIFV